MKTDRKKLYKKIENAIAKGVANGEEVDVTAKSIMDTVWPIIDFLQVHGKPSKDYVNEYIENQNTFKEIKVLLKILNMYDYVPYINSLDDYGMDAIMEFTGLVSGSKEDVKLFLNKHNGKSLNDIQNMIKDFLNKVFPNA